jgi:hypothetical protein
MKIELITNLAKRNGITGTTKVIAIMQYMSIMITYYSLSMVSLNLALLKKIIGKMNGKTKMLTGKKVRVAPPTNLSYETLFFNLIMLNLL